MNKAKKSQAIRTALHTRKQLALKFLKILFCLHAASLGISLIKYLPVPYSLTAWAGRILSVGMIVCLFSLASINPGYRFAGGVRAVVLAQNIIFALLPAPILFSWYQSATSLMIVRIVYGAVLVLTWLATWFEYNSHAGLASVTSRGLAKWWIILFAGSLLVSVLGTVLSWGAAYLSWDFLPLNTVNVIIGILSRVMDALYLWLLYHLIAGVRNADTASA